MLRRNQSGFNLMELMVVLAIIAILASLLLPTLSRAMGQARQTQCANDVRQLGLSLEQFASDHQLYPLSLDAELNNSNIPTNFNTWTEAIEYQLAGDNFEAILFSGAKASGFAPVLSRKGVWVRVSIRTGITLLAWA